MNKNIFKALVCLMFGIIFIPLSQSHQLLYAQEETEEPKEETQEQAQKTQQTNVEEGAANYERNLKVWQGLSEEERQELREKAVSLKDLPEQEKKELREKLQKFDTLPEEERKQVEENFERFRQMPPERKIMLRKKVAQIQGLPEEKRGLIREKFLKRKAEFNLSDKPPAELPKTMPEAPILKQRQIPDTIPELDRQIQRPKPTPSTEGVRQQEVRQQEQEGRKGLLFKKPVPKNKDGDKNQETIKEKKHPVKAKPLNNKKPNLKPNKNVKKVLPSKRKSAQ